MKQSKIVIGSLFGDEGKGITTDFLCKESQGKTIVIRFSGGQQAGHNVKIGNLSHVHSNYGSGALRGVPSYFSEYCTMYPVTVKNERRIFINKTNGREPRVYYHPLVRVTTPADVAWNRLTEKQLCHGSCGLGVSATMKRTDSSPYKLYAIDLQFMKTLEEKLRNILNYYTERVKPEDRDEFVKLYIKEKEAFDEAIKEIPIHIRSYDWLEYFETYIFEGSQGILLDMDHGFFPNVTYANTTSKNALKISRQLGLSDKEISIYYATRCYQTRHGAGYMSNEEPIVLTNTQDEINVENEWQKKFRIGEIDYNLLNYAYTIDHIYSGGLQKNLVVTCMDQRPGFQFELQNLEFNFAKVYESYSPDSKTFIEIPNKQYFR